MTIPTIRLAAAPMLAMAILGATTLTVRCADLGAGCCSDLEERIAELEATTARKGTRKVTLTISGYIAQELTVWDDGEETNAYLHGMGPTQASHVKLNGQAVIMPGWAAGYLLRLQNLDDNPFARSGTSAMDQANDNFSQGLNLQMSFWYIDSKDYGKVSAGKLAHAAKSVVMFTDQSGTQVIDNYTFLAGFPPFVLRSDGDLTPAVTWGNVAFCYAQNLPIGGDCNGVVMNGVRYDTPVFRGFSGSASWGEDDFWEVAGRYAGQHSGFKVSLGIGYSEMTDENTTGAAVMTDKHTAYFQAGGYLQHLATGLFLHGAYGHEDNGDRAVFNAGVNVGPAKDSDHWYVKSGIRQKWMPFGATIVYGDYAEYYDQLGPAALANGATSSELRRYGGGVAQELDAAAMTVYLKYQHYDAEIAGAPALADLEALDLWSAGGLINF